MQSRGALVSLVGAEVLVRLPRAGGYVPMKIAVPDGDDVKRRIGIYARVLIAAYSSYPECLWCGEEIEGAVLNWVGSSNVSSAPHGPYCSTSCWLSAS